MQKLSFKRYKKLMLSYQMKIKDANMTNLDTQHSQTVEVPVVLVALMDSIFLDLTMAIFLIIFLEALVEVFHKEEVVAVTVHSVVVMF